MAQSTGTIQPSQSLREDFDLINKPISPARHLQSLLVVGLAVILLVSPIFFGSAAIWSQGLLFLIAAGLLAVWLLAGLLAGELFVARTGLWLLGLLCLGVAVFQTVRLTWPTLNWLSPATATVYERTLPQLTQKTSETLSVSPQATRSELYRLAIMAMVFVVAINTIRTRKKLIAIVLVLLALGTFQALYAFLSQFSGEQTRLAGTFHSKNQFAGLLSMIVPLSLALAVGLGGQKSPTARLKYGISQWLSSSTFAQQALVTASGVLMGLAVLFSLSRAGLFTLFAGLIGFGVYLLSRAGLRRYTLIIFLIIFVAVGSGALIGMDMVFRGVQDATSLQAISWQGRLDLSRSSLRLIADFSLWGTGLGTLPVAFSRYQSLAEGDWTAYSLHNDWLQMVCENGLIGASLLTAMLVIFLVGVLERLGRSPDRLSKLLAIGALVGAGTMLLHSLWDRNLSKVTSNGIVFAILLALAYAGAHLSPLHSSSEKKTGYWRLSFGPWPIRILLFIAALAGLAKLSVEPVKAGLADIKFNQYLQASPAYPDVCQSYPGGRLLKRDEYFWLKHSGPTNDRDWAIQRLKQARQFSPDNPRYIREEALCLAEDIDRIVDQRAVQLAENLLGEQLKQASELQYTQTVWALAAGIRRDAYIENKPQLRQACLLLQEAVNLAPTKPDYHLDLAMVLARLEKVSSSSADNPIDQTVRPIETAKRQTAIALWLAPHKPAVLFAAGCLDLDRANSSTDERQKQLLLAEVVRNFRRAMFGGPDPRFAYPQRIYQLLEMSRLDGLLFKVTPQAVPATQELALHFLQTRRWEQALRAWQILEDIVDSPAKPVSLSYLAGEPDAADGSEDFTWQRVAGTPASYSPRGKPAELSRGIRGQAILGKCQALAQLGRWDQQQVQISRYQEFTAEETQLALDQAEKFISKRRYQSAMSQYLAVLRRDWTNPQALIGSAEIVEMPGMPANYRRWNGSLEQLYRLVMYNRKLTHQQYERVCTVASGIHPQDEAAQLELDFILAAASCLAERYEQAIASLTALAKQSEKIKHAWGNEHLIWYFLGRAQRAIGQEAQAAGSYKKALKIVPTHLPSLLALQELQDADAGQMLLELTPANRCNIDFGGKVLLLGYTLLNQADGAMTNNDQALENASQWRVRYFWQFQDRVLADCYTEINFCNAQGRYVFDDSHPICYQAGPYYMPTAHWGEVVVEERTLRDDPSQCAQIRFAVRIDHPPVGEARYLLNHLAQEATCVACLTPSDTDKLPSTLSQIEPLSGPSERIVRTSR